MAHVCEHCGVDHGPQAKFCPVKGKPISSGTSEPNPSSAPSKIEISVPPWVKRATDKAMELAPMTTDWLAPEEKLLAAFPVGWQGLIFRITWYVHVTDRRIVGQGERTVGGQAEFLEVYHENFAALEFHKPSMLLWYVLAMWGASGLAAPFWSSRDESIVFLGVVLWPVFFLLLILLVRWLSPSWIIVKGQPSVSIPGRGNIKEKFYQLAALTAQLKPAHTTEIAASTGMFWAKAKPFLAILLLFMLLGGIVSWFGVLGRLLF